MSTPRPQWVYITTAHEDEARTIAKAVVSERLAACANILPTAESIYRWEGNIREDQETLLILKTSSDHNLALTQRICELHSYDCPAVVALDIQDGNPDYLDWIIRETS